MVIQHPGGKVERLHEPAKEGEVMRGNPRHYVRSWSSASPRLIPAAAAGRSQGHQGEAHRAPGRAAAGSGLPPRHLARCVPSLLSWIPLPRGPIHPFRRRRELIRSPTDILMLSRTQRWRRRSKPGARTRRDSAWKLRPTTGGRRRSRGPPPSTTR